MDVIKKKYPLLDENGQPSTYPTFASQVFFGDGSVLDGKEFGVDPLTIYPVGSIYMSANETSPAELFGGAWEQLKDRFLLGAGSAYAVGSEGGEESVSIAQEQMPSHYHVENLPINSNEVRPVGVKVLDDRHTDTTAVTAGINKSYTGGISYGGVSASAPVYLPRTQEAGGGQPHNNMPPYLAVYMWRRIA